MVTVFVVFFGPIAVSVGMLAIIQPFWPVLRYAMLAYTCWIVFIDDSPSNGGNPSTYFQNLSVWNYFRDYFPAKLIVKKKLDSAKRYVFCLHPHGIIGMSMWPTLFMGCENAKERLGVDFRICTISLNFKLPLWREFVMAFGFIDAGKRSFNNTLSQGTSVCVVVGGAREALLAKPGQLNLTLARRKGFVKYALQQGAGLVPVFSFGENELYKTVTFPDDSIVRRAQNWFMEKSGFSTPLFTGRGIFNKDFGLLPHRHPCYTIVGEPMDIPHIKDPTIEQINKWHAEYIKVLTKLYEENRDACGYKGIELVISE